MIEQIATDVLVIGSGAAGLCAAISARGGGADTLMASISNPGAGNATSVSGGIFNAAIGQDDSAQIHFEDTLRAGALLNDRPLALQTIEMIPSLLSRLEEYGVRFAKDDDHYRLARSPGHSRARTMLFQPRVGVTLSKPLVNTAISLGVKTLPNFNAVKILVEDNRAVGVIGYLWETDQIVHIAAKVVVMATGGASLTYSRTRIPPGVPGDGHGIALEAGLTLQDMEFVQFYPTVLAEPDMPKVMIGYEYFLKAGAKFVNSLGEDIIAKHQLPEPEMITRDQLSTAMAREIYEGRGVDGAVMMDASRCSAGINSTLYNDSPFGKMVRERQAQGENVLARPIRVAPANHYYMGGVQADTNGKTAIEGLLACGEIVGGTHGANRLQGNSLSETVVAGFETGRTAANLSAHLSISNRSGKQVTETAGQLRGALTRTSGTPVKDVIKALQDIMTSKAALVRDGSGLSEAKAALDELRNEIPRAVALAPKERGQLCTLARLFDTAESIVLSALARHESRGAHYRLDFPQRDDAAWIKHITCAKHGSEMSTSTCPIRE